MAKTEIDVIERLKELSGWGDYEGAHVEADEILCEWLTILGYEELVKEYRNVPKWYA